MTIAALIIGLVLGVVVGIALGYWWMIRVLVSSLPTDQLAAVQRRLRLRSAQRHALADSHEARPHEQ